MRLHVFHAAEGDCFLLETSDGKHILIDGGRSSSFVANTLPTLSLLQQQGTPLDLVIVTHVDQDHIEGILTLIELTIAWRVFDFQQQANGIANPPQPDDPRPPDINEIWHNSFSALLDDLVDPATNAIINASERLNAPLDHDMIGNVDATVAREWAERAAALATSIRQGLILRRRIGGDNLNIPLNTGFPRSLVKRTGQTTRAVGTVTLEILAPSQDNLDDLQHAWRKWVTRNEDKAAVIDSETIVELSSQAYGSGFNTFDDLAAAQLRESAAFADFIADELATRLTANANAKRSAVTPQNRASITVLARESQNGQPKTILFTGDAHQDEIIEGLVAHGHLTDGGNDAFHVNVLKVQHHGSEFNLDTSFCDRVTADDYIFSSDGSHHNPDRAVIKAIIDRRLARKDKAKFTLTFNTSATRPGISTNDAANIQYSIDYATRRAAKYGQITIRLLADNRKGLVITP